MEGYWEVLGLDPGAGHDEVVAAYRRAAMASHPDRPGGDAEAFRRVQEAYRALCDPEEHARLEEEQRRREAWASVPVVNVTPEMARAGASVRVPLPKWADCGQCDATGRVQSRRSCKGCGGAGSVPAEVHTHPFLLPCQDCGGTGRASSACPQCTRGRTLVSLTRRVRLPKGCKDGAKFKLDGRPGFQVRVVARP